MKRDMAKQVQKNADKMRVHEANCEMQITELLRDNVALRQSAVSMQSFLDQCGKQFSDLGGKLDPDLAVSWYAAHTRLAMRSIVDAMTSRNTVDAWLSRFVDDPCCLRYVDFLEQRLDEMRSQLIVVASTHPISPEIVRPTTGGSVARGLSDSAASSAETSQQVGIEAVAPLSPMCTPWRGKENLKEQQLSSQCQFFSLHNWAE